MSIFISVGSANPVYIAVGVYSASLEKCLLLRTENRRCFVPRMPDFVLHAY
jgi:hypothetical protein